MTLQGPRDTFSNRLGRRSTTCDFYARLVVFDGQVQDFDIVTWELEPLDDNRRACSEWIEEHLLTDVDCLFEQLEINGEGAWEAVFRGSIHGYWIWTDCGDEYDEEIEIDDFLSQQLPTEWFQ